MALQQFLPGKCRGLSGQDIVQGPVHERKRPGELLDLELAGLDTLRRKGERLHHPAQTGVAGKHGKERTGVRQSRDDLFDIGEVVKQQAVALEKIAAVGLSNQRKQLRIFCQRLRQSVGGLFGVLRRRRPHDRRNALLREGPG